MYLLNSTSSIKTQYAIYRCFKYYKIVNQSTPPIPPLSAVLETLVKGVIYNQEKHIRDLKISSGMGEAVTGGAVLGGGGGGRLYILILCFKYKV